VTPPPAAGSYAYLSAITPASPPQTQQPAYTSFDGLRLPDSFEGLSGAITSAAAAVAGGGDDGGGGGDGFSLFSSPPRAAGSSNDGSVSNNGGAVRAEHPHGASQTGHDPKGMGPSRSGGGSGCNTPLVNEVVCSSLMLAYERAGRWGDAVHVLRRARDLGVTPNVAMLNVAISAAGKAGQVELAEGLFAAAGSARDVATHEALLMAYAVAGLAEQVGDTYVNSLIDRVMYILYPCRIIAQGCTYIWLS
jgi:pentatricopeptide repeat protein